MKILTLTVDEFGCLSDQKFDLSEGFNLITGENESGKSTLLGFIKFILYGMPRKSQENIAERERSISKKSGRASGSMHVRLDSGEEYLIERRGILRSSEKRESYSEDCRIIDCGNGLQVHKGAVPGELFLGVPVAVFESTCFVKQMKSGEIDGDRVGDSLSNMLLSADERLDLQKALERLDAGRKVLLHKSGRGGSLAALTEELDSLTLRLDKARAASERILAASESAEELRKNALAKRHELDKLEDAISAFNSVSVIRRFDLMRQRLSELEVLKARRAELVTQNTVSGALPTRELPVKAREAARRFEDAEREKNRAEGELERAREAYRGRGRRCKDFTADELRQIGGVDAVCSGMRCDEDKASSKKKKAIILTVLAMISVLSGAVMAALLPPLLFFGLGLCAVAIILLSIGLALFSSSKKHLARLCEQLERFAPPECDSIDQVRLYLMSAFEDESDERQLADNVSRATKECEIRASILTEAKEYAESVLSIWRASENTDVCAAIEETAARAEKYFDALDSLDREIRPEIRGIDELKKELAEYNEADLRARIPKELIDSLDSDTVDEIDRRRRFCSSALRSLNEKQMDTERELTRLQSENEDPARVAQLLESAREKYESEKLKYDAIVTAYEALETAGGNIRDSLTPIIRKRSGEYLSSFTEGKYSSLGIENGCIAASAEGDGFRSSIESLSAGTRDAVYLALRVTLLGVLFKKEQPPLALDEALAQLDDRRAQAVLGMLGRFCADGGQCLLFSCHDREGRLLEDVADVNRLAI